MLRYFKRSTRTRKMFDVFVPFIYLLSGQLTHHVFHVRLNRDVVATQICQQSQAGLREFRFLRLSGKDNCEHVTSIFILNIANAESWCQTFALKFGALTKFRICILKRVIQC